MVCRMRGEPGLSEAGYRGRPDTGDREALSVAGVADPGSGYAMLRGLGLASHQPEKIGNAVQVLQQPRAHSLAVVGEGD